MGTKAREFLLKKCEKPTVDRDFNAIEAHPLKLCDPKDIEAERILKYIRVIEYSSYEKIEAENKKMRETLKQFSDPNFYWETPPKGEYIWVEYGRPKNFKELAKIAREALGEVGE